MNIIIKNQRHGLRLICFVQIFPKRETQISLESYWSPSCSQGWHCVFPVVLISSALNIKLKSYWKWIWLTCYCKVVENVKILLGGKTTTLYWPKIRNKLSSECGEKHAVFGLAVLFYGKLMRRLSQFLTVKLLFLSSLVEVFPFRDISFKFSKSDFVYIMLFTCL